MTLPTGLGEPVGLLVGGERITANDSRYGLNAFVHTRELQRLPDR